MDGTDVQSLKLIELAGNMAFVPVTTDSAFSLSVIDTVMMGRHPHSKPGSYNQDLKICYEALKMVDMAEFAMKNAGALSAGQLQRVAMAKGIAQAPKILILDEPTANLDIRHQILTTELLAKISKEKGMITLMIGHDLNIASKYADKMIVMPKPRIIHSVGTPSEVTPEKTMEEVYGVKSSVIEYKGRPHVILDSATSIEGSANQ